MIVVHSTCYYVLVFAVCEYHSMISYVIAQIVLQERWLITRNMTSVLNMVSIHYPQPYTVIHLSFLLCQQKVLDDVFLVSSTEDVTETDVPRPRERSNIVLFVLCGLVVTFGAVGVWKMRLKKGKPLLGHPEIKQDRGTRHKMDSTSTTTPNISSGSVMHRKLKSSV